MGESFLAVREQPSIPAWKSDELDSSVGPEIEAPYFDKALGAWVLSRHKDILAAFRSPKLFPAGRQSGVVEPQNDGAKVKMREETQAALSPVHIKSWSERLAAEAWLQSKQLRRMPVVDLVDGYARPLCVCLAAMVTGIAYSEALRLLESARKVSAAAAEPYDLDLENAAGHAQRELESCFPSGPTRPRDSGFVAIAETIPCLLANAWFALIRDPEAWELLHRLPELTGQAIEELLRFAGPVRTLFRTAMEDVTVAGVMIRRGELVVLRIIAGNRDPERFERANEIDVMRSGAGHFSLGWGSHSCTGANLIRMAAVTISGPLLRRFSRAELTESVAWRGGSGFRAPVALWVQLHEA